MDVAVIETAHEQLRAKVARGDELRQKLKTIERTTVTDDLPTALKSELLRRGKEIVAAESRKELESLFAPPAEEPDHEGWERICDFPECYGVFVGDGDDMGCQQPMAIFASRTDADLFVEWQKSLPEDHQRGDLHVHGMRDVCGEFWNWGTAPNWGAPRIPRD